MDKWEYLSEQIRADASDGQALAYARKKWPQYKPAHHDPALLAYYLDLRGAEGWELMHIEPVSVGEKRDILLHSYNLNVSVWASVYLCIFKRRIPG